QPVVLLRMAPFDRELIPGVDTAKARQELECQVRGLLARRDAEETKCEPGVGALGAIKSGGVDHVVDQARASPHEGETREEGLLVVAADEDDGVDAVPVDTLEVRRPQLL